MKTTYRRFARMALLAGGLALSGGCLKINTTLYLTADGGGTWQVKYAMPAFMIRQTQMIRQLAEDLEKAGGGPGTNRPVAKPDIPLLFEEAAIRERFKPLEAQGIRIAKLGFASRAGWQYVEMTVKFDRLETLAGQAFFDGCGFSLTRTPENVAKLVVSLPRGATDGEAVNTKDPAVARSLSPFLAGLAVMARIEAPGAIKNSNSGFSDQRMATWEWDYDKDATVVERLARDKMMVVFDAKNLRMADFEKPAKP